jgi:antitoxin component of MazEF toxin-antitoxin module
MPHNGQPLYVSKIWKIGNSVGFPLYKALLKAIHANIGDMLLVRVHPPYVTFRVAHPDQLVPVERFTEEELPPDWPNAVKTADARTR